MTLFVSWMNGQTFCLLHAKLTFNHQWVYHMSSRLSVDVRGNRHTSLPSDKLQYTVLCLRSTKLPLELLGNKAKKKSFPLIKISSAIPCSSFHVKVLPLLTKLQLPEHRCHSWQSEITFFLSALRQQLHSCPAFLKLRSDGLDEGLRVKPVKLQSKARGHLH